jgi:hypothetical protein
VTRAPVPGCAVDVGVPGCDTGPAGRLSFVLREARDAWRTRRARTAADTPGDELASAHVDGRPALPSGDTR